MTYHDLLAAAKADPNGADFHTLRMAYTRSDTYNPYAQDAENVGKLQAALQSRQMDTALEALTSLLERNYLDIEAHMAADYIHTMLEQHPQAAYHRAWATGLLRAILATGDGRGFDTAWIVLSVAEEYTIVRVMRMSVEMQRLVQHEGHWFDILRGRRSDSPDIVELHFNIDLPRGWLNQHIRNISDPPGGES
jgi:hypothetical protein